MLLWLVIAVLATLVALVLLLAVRRDADELPAENHATDAHYRAQMEEIEQDLRIGRLSQDQAEAVRAELAREMVRQKKADDEDGGAASLRLERGILPAAGIAVPLMAVAVYALMGQPDMPNRPLAMRGEERASQMTLDEAIGQVESQLAQTPDDLRGWQVLGPAYMRAERFADAETAFRRILDLSEPTPDRLTDLAEARLMQADGVASDEVVELLERAVDMDPRHIRSRFYLAGEATREARWDEARQLWSTLIDLAEGGEPWLEVAERGLAAARAEGDPDEAETGGSADTGPDAATNADQQEMIRSMVEGLQSRLSDQGGSVEEWVQLIRSRIVLGETGMARTAYEDAIAAYPDGEARARLDEMARSAGLLEQ